MAVILNTKVSGTHTDGTNSYVDTAYADDYFSNHWLAANSAAWDALDDAPKATLLIAAARVIESARFTNIVVHTDWRFHRYYNRLTMQIMNFQLLREPVKYFFYQLMQFPRNLDIDLVGGLPYIPEAIKMAQCEQAVYMLTFDQSALSNRLQGITSDAIGVGRSQILLKQTYGSEGTMFAPQAYEMIKPFLVRNVRQRRA
jgi:hypothetical protein